MAILEALPGIEVTIELHGRALPEYRDDNQEWAHNGKFDIVADKRSSNYVECVSDAKFRIALSMKLPPFNLDCDCLTFGVRIDGQAVGDTTCSIFNRASPTAYVATSRERLNANEVIRRSFKFATIRKIDDADSHRVEHDAKSLFGVGEIMVFVYRSYEQPTLAWNPTSKLLENAPNEIAEKALEGQALSHGVAYGDESRERSVKKKRVLIDGRRPLIL